MMFFALFDFLKAPEAAPDPASGGATTGIWGYVVSIGPVVALILSPVIGWVIARKKDKPTQEQGIIQEVQEERNEMKKQRDEALATNKEINKVLDSVQAKVREFEELMVKARIEKMEQTAELLESRRLNTELANELATIRAELLAMKTSS